MTQQEKVRRDFMISVYPKIDAPGEILVNFVSHGLMAARGWNGAPPCVPTCLVKAYLQGDNIVASVIKTTPEDYKVNRQTLEEEAADRLAKRVAWLRRLSDLMDSAHGMALELGWSTKKIRKELKDAEIGDYSAPALLLQEETTRALLEPIGRSTPGSEGVVDLYLLPAYDDVAKLLYYDGRWNIHYLPPDAPPSTGIRDMRAKPLSKTTLKKILSEMRAHVA